MANVKELMEKQLNKSFENSKRKNRLIEKLPREEMDEYLGAHPECYED